MRRAGAPTATERATHRQCIFVGIQHCWLASTSDFHGVANLHFLYRLIFVMEAILENGDSEDFRVFLDDLTLEV